MAICERCLTVIFIILILVNSINNSNFNFFDDFETDDVDTRAITRRLREDGSLIGVLSTEDSQTDEELLEIARKWKIVGGI